MLVVIGPEETLKPHQPPQQESLGGPEDLLPSEKPHLPRLAWEVLPCGCPPPREMRTHADCSALTLVCAEMGYQRMQGQCTKGSDFNPFDNLNLQISLRIFLLDIYLICFKVLGYIFIEDL